MGSKLISGSNPTPYGYKAQWGYYTDVETGILLLTHRYFDPAMGRFLTRDPIGIEGGMNLYAYVGNGVVTTADPQGLHNKEKCFEAVAKARELARKIEEHLQKIRDNLPPVASLCIPSEPCAAAPRRPDHTLLEKWENYRGHVKDVEGLKRRLEEVLNQIDNNCNNHWKNYFHNEIKYFEGVLNAPIPEWPGGLYPCVPLPYPWPPRIPTPVPIRPPILVPI